MEKKLFKQKTPSTYPCGKLFSLLSLDFSMTAKEPHPTRFGHYRPKPLILLAKKMDIQIAHF